MKTSDYIWLAITFGLVCGHVVLRLELRESRTQTENALAAAHEFENAFNKEQDNALGFRRLVVDCVDSYAPATVAADIHRIMEETK